MTITADQGRQSLAGWCGDQPQNFFDSDRLLGLLLARSGAADRKEELRAFGALAAGPLDAAVAQNNLLANLPRVEDYDGIGHHTAEIGFHPSYHEAGAYMYGSGMMEAYSGSPPPHPFILSLFYLSSHVGEGGHNCPLACTAGAIRALRALGTDEQKRSWLPKLQSTDYTGTHLSAAQFLTEVQGGSDVGANDVVAVRSSDGSFRISGEKWFCSSADAGLFLLTARPEGASEGTKGLALFLVPRLVDGKPNGFTIRRLKDKLGTRTMATAEIDFASSWGQPLGPLDLGFKNTMELVINTSRLYNAMGCAGLAHRACLVAEGYARHRRAFGDVIGKYPLVKETLALMRADAEACLAGTFWLAEIQEKVDGSEATDDERAFLRMGLNLNKVRTAVLSHAVINRGIEVLGGNGTIETFSALPRLLRDNVVFENWEGTHHTLRLQVLRDAKRLGVHKGFFATLKTRFPEREVSSDERAFAQCLESGDTLLLRRLCDRLGSWLHLAALATIDDDGIRARGDLSKKVHLSRNDALDPGYGELIDRCGS